MSDLKIEILDSIHCKASNLYTKEALKPVLSFEEVIERPGPRGPIRKSRRVSLINSKGFFPTGMYNRVEKFLGSRQGSVIVNEPPLLLEPKDICPLDKVIYREYQKEAIRTGLHYQRGTIKAPARSGKTVIAAGIIKSLQEENDTRSLFLVNTKDILYQTKEAFDSYGLEAGVVGGGKKELDAKNIIATYQSMKAYADIERLYDFGVILVDEAHHARKINGSYWNILMNCPAPVKLGLTATIPEREGEKMVMEALLGPVIYEITQEKAKEIGATVKARIKIVKAPEHVVNVKRMSYLDAYQTGVIENRSLNRLIVMEAVKYLEEKNTVLILVSRVQHGFQIERIFNLLFPQYKTPFLCGGIDSETKSYLEDLKRRLEKFQTKRELASKIESEISKVQELEKEIRKRAQNRNEYRHAFINREISCVIATNIWNEGVNIPTLNVLINAAGGKSEIRTIQASSRSLTACPGKSEGVIVDVFNPIHTSFINHFGHRIATYCELGWM